MKKRMFVALVAAVVALASVFIFAQANTADLRGKAIDEKGQPMAGATVRITTADGRKLEAKTEPTGEFAFSGVPAGKIKIELLVDGKPRTGGESEVLPGQVNVLNLDLQAAAAAAKMTPEQRKKMEQENEDRQKKAQAEHNKIKNLNAMLAQGKQMMDSGNYEGAVGIYDNAVKTDPTKDLVWANLGLAYLGQAEKTQDSAQKAQSANKSIEAFQKAISINPNNGAYHNNLGQAYARAGNTADALKEFQTAGQMDPTAAARYYFNAGATLTNESTKLPPGTPEQKKKLDDANEMFKKSAAADPKYSGGEAYYQIATNLLSEATMSKDGKMVVPDGTADAYHKYLEESPNGRYAESAKQTLAALGSSVETSYKKGGSSKKK